MGMKVYFEEFKADVAVLYLSKIRRGRMRWWPGIWGSSGRRCSSGQALPGQSAPGSGLLPGRRPGSGRPRPGQH